MKHTATILFLALFVIVGTASAQTKLHAYPSVVDFYDTSSPCAYVLTFTKTSGSEVYDTVTVTPSAHTVVSGDTGKTYSSTPIQVLVPQSLLTFPTAPQMVVYVKAVTSTPITLHETIKDTDNAGQSAPESVTGDIPLPIQLASFKAATFNSKGVSLNWTTVSETNNYGFYVQRNGVDITFIAGHGTTLKQHTYSFTDDPSPGQYQYRLKQVDLDGTATLSESVVIDVVAPSKFALKQNYPNPFNPSTQISFSIAKEGPVSLRVYDVLGREVATMVNENRKPGQYTESFNGNQMASGVYIYVLRSSEGQLVGRMMMLK